MLLHDMNSLRNIYQNGKDQKLKCKIRKKIIKTTNYENLSKQPIAEETIKSNVLRVIVEVFFCLKLFSNTYLLKISQMSLRKKLSIFSYMSCQIRYFLRKFKISKNNVYIDGLIIKHLTLQKSVSIFFQRKKITIL